MPRTQPAYSSDKNTTMTTGQSRISELKQKYGSFPEWQWRHLKPRHWHAWMLLWAARALACLPMGCIMRAGKSLGRLATKLPVLKKQKHVIARNLELCFPELSPAEREKILVRNLEHYGMAALGCGLSFVGKKPRYDKIFRAEGIEHLKQLSKDGRPVLIFTYHMSIMGMGCHIVHHAMAEAGISGGLNVIYRIHNDPVMNYAIMRCRNGVTPATSIRNIPRSKVRDAVTLLKDSQALIIAADHDHGRKSSVFVPFFGQMAATAPIVRSYARMANAAVVPLQIYIDEQSQQHVARLEAPLDNFPTDNREADTARVNQIMERAIRQHPEQYFWAYSRFRTRPNESDPSLYEWPPAPSATRP